MSVDQRLVAGISRLTGLAVRALHGEQLGDDQPVQVPLIVVSRIGSEWSSWSTVCKGNADIAEVMLQIDVYTTTLAQCRTLMDQIRRWVVDNLPASLDSEFDLWDSERVYRTTATFTVTDDSPNAI
jgi:hypothetical protein